MLPKPGQPDIGLTSTSECAGAGKQFMDQPIETARAGDSPRETAALSLEEQLVLWAMRVWVSHFKRDQPPCAAFSRAFAIVGAAEAADHLGALMSVIASGAIRSIEIRCPACPALADDEALLLGAVAKAQRGVLSAVFPPLQDLVIYSAARAATSPLVEFGRALLAAGHVLPQRIGPDAPQAIGPLAMADEGTAAYHGQQSCCADPGAKLIH